MVYIRWFEDTRREDVPIVGGKNASLGEMISNLKQKGIRVPEGFATTADAYWAFLEEGNLKDKIVELLKKKDGAAIRHLIEEASFSESLTEELKKAYAALSKRYKQKNADVAVRSSATAEDLPDASFAGQQDTYLHIKSFPELLKACKKCFASLFTDRAISYREAKGFDHMKVALSIGVQKMVRSDKACSGVLFTLDPENGFREVVVINGSWGLGENIVQGAVNPDEYVVFKPLGCIIRKTLGNKSKKMIYAKEGIKNIKTSKRERGIYVLNDEEVATLANWGIEIEKHYGTPMDIEWAKDGKTKELFVVQARPETVHSRQSAQSVKTFELKQRGKVLCQGLSIGEATATGKVQVIKNVHDIKTFIPGSFLVTESTSPDWVPIMQQAKGIITDQGGRTSHAAIVSRELGLPAIVGTHNATNVLKNGQDITISCGEGEIGYIYEGILPFEEKEIRLDQVPKIKTQVMMNIASPGAAFHWWWMPCQGIGLARMEFIINNIIQIHPMALIRYPHLKDKKAKKKIDQLTQHYHEKTEYFVDKLAQGIGQIAAARYPYPVIVRMSDFKTNEYANLIGGEEFEPKEENPMLGFRGASRYYNPRYKEGFALECQAIARVRDKMKLKNVVVMIPFCRTLEEADRVLEVLAENGLKRHQDGLEVYVMCEIPSNVILAEEFADRFDGFSIGSNDLTQLVLGIDRDSAELASLFDERNPAVKKMIANVIDVARKKNCKIGICGQAPSDYPEFAEFLVRCGIDSISLNPDSILPTIQRLAKLEEKTMGITA